MKPMFKAPGFKPLKLDVINCFQIVLSISNDGGGWFMLTM
jgi:hypothetical protein